MATNKTGRPNRLSTYAPHVLSLVGQKAFFAAMESDPEVRDAMSALFGKPFDQMTEYERTTAYNLLTDVGFGTAHLAKVVQARRSFLSVMAAEALPELPITLEGLKAERKRAKQHLRRINDAISSMSQDQPQEASA